MTIYSARMGRNPPCQCTGSRRTAISACTAASCIRSTSSPKAATATPSGRDALRERPALSYYEAESNESPPYDAALLPEKSADRSETCHMVKQRKTPDDPHHPVSVLKLCTPIRSDHLFLFFRTRTTATTATTITATITTFADMYPYLLSLRMYRAYRVCVSRRFTRCCRPVKEPSVMHAEIR